MSFKKNYYTLTVTILSIILMSTLFGCNSKVSEEGLQNIEEIKIGSLFPLSGAMASMGKNIKNAQDMAVDEINSSGGIKSLNGAKLKLIYADSRSDPKIGVSETERLILQENVVAMLGAYQSSVTYPTTDIAERYEIPYLIASAIMPEITQRGFKYIFRINAISGTGARDMINVLIELSDSTGVKPETLAIVWENTEFGQSTHGYLLHFLEEKDLDINIILDEGYPAGLADAVPLVLKLQSVQPDIVFMVSGTADAILIANTIAEMNFNALAFITAGSGHTDPEFVKVAGKNAEYYFGCSEYSSDIDRPLAKEKNEEYKRRYGSDFPPEAGVNAYSSIYVLADALERAASTDPKAIRDALATTNITEGPAVITPYDTIKFDETGQNIASKVVFLQVQNGRYRTIYPLEARPSDVVPVYPRPPWNQ